MRIVERCACGAQIEVLYEIDPRGYGRKDEGPEGRKMIENFRKRHRPCLDPKIPTLPQMQAQPSPNQCEAA